MILKIEIKEQIEDIYKYELSVNLVNKNVSYIKGETVIKNGGFDTSEQDLIDLFKDYATYWANEMSGEATVRNRFVEINVYTDKEIVNYHFENSFPEDLDEFLKVLKNKLDIVD